MRDNPQLALQALAKAETDQRCGRSLANVARNNRQADLVSNGLGDSSNVFTL